MRSQLISLFAGLGLALTGAAFAQSDDPLGPRPGEQFLGAEDAPLVVIEYASFACPHCATFQTEAWPTIEAEFVSTGQVRFGLRPMLTAPPTVAAYGIILTECAADDRFFATADLLFHEQANIFATGRAGENLLPVYSRIAAAVGLSEQEMLACFQNEEMLNHINVIAQQAMDDGVPGTPSFAIRGQILRILGDGSVLWGGEPLIVDGEPFRGRLDGDTFRRIILHFLDMPETEQ